MFVKILAFVVGQKIAAVSAVGHDLLSHVGRHKNKDDQIFCRKNRTCSRSIIEPNKELGSL